MSQMTASRRGVSAELAADGERVLQEGGLPGVHGVHLVVRVELEQQAATTRRLHVERLDAAPGQLLGDQTRTGVDLLEALRAELVAVVEVRAEERPGRGRDLLVAVDEHVELPV